MYSEAAVLPRQTRTIEIMELADYVVKRAAACCLPLTERKLQMVLMCIQLEHVILYNEEFFIAVTIEEKQNQDDFNAFPQIHERYASPTGINELLFSTNMEAYGKDVEESSNRQFEGQNDLNVIFDYYIAMPMKRFYSILGIE